MATQGVIFLARTAELVHGLSGTYSRLGECVDYLYRYLG